MLKKAVLASSSPRLSSRRSSPLPATAQHGGPPAVLSVRQQADLVYKITAKRLDTLLPRLMRETGFDMWIVSCNEDNLDPIFETMVPLGNWNPITQILVFFDAGTGQGRRTPERLPHRHPGPVQERLGRRRPSTRRRAKANGKRSAASSASATRSGSASTRARSSGRPGR
ncbi:MAG: hypothetical protein M0C28_25180 [Candidatus Moduliflexus flocculans]|nr:hypothetical protein [Candidatus Moduliflexus flocculans]